MRAQNEAEVLAQMEKHLDNFGGRIGSVNTPWTRAKQQALDLCEDVNHVLDVGIGDMSHINAWEPFCRGQVLYTAFDGSERILHEAESKYEHISRSFTQATLSELCTGDHGPFDARVDLTICLDVLYHIPDDALYEDFLLWLTETTDRYLLVSYATSMAAPGDPQKVGDPGFAWFPRPFHVPAGFTVIHRQNNDGMGQPQKQEVALLLRNARG